MTAGTAGFMCGIFDPEWTSYTPVWTAAHRDPELGNGTLHGRGQVLDGVVRVEILLVVGSTTDLGDGRWSFQPPYPVSQVLRGSLAQALDDSSCTAHLCNVRLVDGRLALAAGCVGECDERCPGRVGPTTPFTWGPGDQLRVSARCAVAPPARPGYRPGMAGIPSTCERCGSLVADGYRAIHDDWHLRVERGI